MPTYTSYDAALETIHEHGPGLKNGLFNHAPMVAEALCALGCESRVADWIDAELSSFTPRVKPCAPIDHADWARAIGQPRRFDDWSRFFLEAFEEQGWQDTLDLWSHRLAPGFTTAACHGVLRVAHATRALRRRESEIRLRELAEGLAAWAALFAKLPVRLAPGTGELEPRNALAHVSSVPKANRAGEGLIIAGYASLRHAEDFSDQVGTVDLSGTETDRIDDLVVTFAEFFVHSARTPYEAIVLAHAVTGAAAVRHFVNVIDSGTLSRLLVRAWESGCALKAAFVDDERPPLRLPNHIVHDVSSHATAAADHGDDHVIKLTEACLSTYQRRPSEILLAAAQRSRELIDRE